MNNTLYEERDVFFGINNLKIVDVPIYQEQFKDHLPLIIFESTLSIVLNAKMSSVSDIGISRFDLYEGCLLLIDIL